MDDLEDLKESTQRGSRLDEDSEEPADFVDELVDCLDAVENGDASNTLSLYDPTLSALVLALEQNPGRVDDWELDDPDRSDVIRAVVRRGLADCDGELLEDAREAIGRHAANSSGI